MVTPVTVSVPPISLAPEARKVPATSNRRCGVSVPIPTLPSPSTRSCSAPPVLMMTDEASAASCNASAAVTSGVLKEVLAASCVPVSAVKVPATGVVPPMIALSIVPPEKLPPPIATSLVWNWPPEVMIARTRLLVTSRRSTLFVAPMKLLPALGALPSAPPLLVALLPVRVQAAPAVTGLTQTRLPPPSVESTLPLSPSAPGSVQTRLPMSVFGARKPTKLSPARSVNCSAEVIEASAVGCSVTVPEAASVVVVMPPFASSRPPTLLPPVTSKVGVRIPPFASSWFTRVAAPLTVNAPTNSVAPSTRNAPPMMPAPEVVIVVVPTPPLAVSKPVSVVVLVATRVVKRPVFAVMAPIAVFSMPPVARSTPPTVASPEVVSVVVDTPLLAVSRPPKVPVPEALRLVVVTPPLAVSRPVRVETPSTDSALPRVVAPVTPKVPATVALPVAASVVKRPVFAVVTPIAVFSRPPVTARLPPISAAPDARKVPATSNRRCGLLVPMPTSPLVSMRSRSPPLVLNARTLAVGIYMPLPPLLPPVMSANLRAEAVPVVARLLPSKVSAAPVVSCRLALRKATPFAVPPFSVTAPEAVSVDTLVAPVTSSVPPMTLFPVARKVPATSKRLVGLLLPIPTLPPLAIRSRSAPLVLAVMMFAPVAASDSVPASAVRPSELVPLTVGVRTPPVAVVSPVTPSVPATVALPVASRVVKRPVLAVVAPIEVLLIVPLRTSMFWMRNSPESSMIARTILPATNCSGCELVEPR